MSLRILFGLCALAFATNAALAQDDHAKYPTRAIHVVVGFAAGGGNDVIARIYAQKLSEDLGQPVIVENKPGAGAIVATEYVSKAAPDGYTLLIGASGMAINQSLYAKLPYDSLDQLRAKLFADTGKPTDDNENPTESDAGEGKLGITVTPVPANLSSKLGVKGGVVIASVRPGSFADEINLTKGVVIVEINKHAVTDEASYRSIVSSLKSGEDVVFVVRGAGVGNGNTYVGGTLP